MEEQREPMQSPDIGKLAEALSKAQSKMEGAKKDGNNPFFKSDYSTLFSVWQACRGPLTENSLSVTQTMGGNGTGLVTVYTTLMHSSGQWVKSALSIIPGKAGPQELGSCITYLRRYALAAMVGLSPLDDDAEAAMQETRKEPAKKPSAKAAEKPKNAPSPIDLYLGTMKKAKETLSKLTGSDDAYYQALKLYGISHANEMKDLKEGEELIKDLRKFAKRATEVKKEEQFPPE